MIASKEKKEAEYQRSLKNARKQGYVPVISCFYVTQRCNYSCEYCSARDNTSRDMPLSDALKVIDILHMLGNRNLSLTGGEPYLRPELFDMIDYASCKCMKVVSVTNGSLLDECKIERLERAGLDVLGLGMESLGAPERAYGKHMDPKKRELLTMLQARAFYTVVAIVLNRQNYHEVPEMVQYYNSLGHGTSVMTLIPNNRIMSDSPLLFRDEDIAGLEVVLARLMNMKRAGAQINEAPSYFEKIPAYIRGEYTWNCIPGIELSVMSDGRINLCTDECILEDSIFDIRDISDFARIVEKARPRLEKCSGCLWDYKMKPTQSVMDPEFWERHELV